MPLYEYECAKCGKRFEKIEKVTAPVRQKCPKCGGKAERLQSAPAIQFKGSGWYVTDYAGKSGGAKSEGKDSTDTKETKESKDTKEKKETLPSKESGKKTAKEK
ncbi:MAG: zinc ribbon domain-containing protein [Acidobacteria bacterium]|nr:zinc ribbon domain-containing protein [Acidobacteriota bacterium]